MQLRNADHPSLSERGETYVELLITTVIVGLAAIAIIGALLTSISASTEHRNLASNDNVVKSALESVKSQVQFQTGNFYDCSTVNSAPSGTPPVGTGKPDYILNQWKSSLSLPSRPAGFSLSLTAVECWNQSLGGFDPHCSSSDTSLCGVHDRTGIERITVSGTDPSGYDVKLSTIVRNPNYSSNDTTQF